MSCKKLTFEWDDAAQRFSGMTNLSDQGEDVEVQNLVASFMRDLVRYSGIKTQQTWVRVLISLSIIISCLAGGYLLLSHKKTELFGMLLIGFTPFGMFLYLMLSCRAVSRAKKVNDWLQLRLNVFSSKFKALGFDLNCVFQEVKEEDKLESPEAAPKPSQCSPKLVVLGFIQIEEIHGRELQIVDSGSRAEGFNFINNKPSSSFSPAKGNSSDSIAFAPPQKVKITPPKVVKKSGVSVIVAKKVGSEQKIGPQNEQFDDSAKNLIRPQQPKSPSPPRNLVEVVSISPSKKAGVVNHEREESPPSIISNLQNSDKLEKSKKSISIKQPSSMQNRNTTGKPDFSSREDKSTMQDTQTTQKPILNNLALSDSQSVENGIQDRNNPGTKSRDDKSKWILGSVIDEEESDFEDNHSPKYKESSHSELRNPSRYMSAIKIEKEELTKAERFKMIRSKGKTAFEIGTKPLESLQNGRKHPRHHSNTQREMGDAT